MEEIKLETQIEFKVPWVQKMNPNFSHLGKERVLFLNWDNGTKGQDGPGGHCRGSCGRGRHRALSAAGPGQPALHTGSVRGHQPACIFIFPPSETHRFSFPSKDNSDFEVAASRILAGC